MVTEEIAALMNLIVLGMLALALIVWTIIDNKNKKIILEKSQKVKLLLDLNQTTNFISIQPRYSNHAVCNSKRMLDNFSLDNYFETLIYENESYYRRIVDSLSFNRREYDKYIQKISLIESTATEEFCRSFGFTLTKFLKYEERVFQRKTLRKPQFDVIIHCKATYTSPQGRNHYLKEINYSFMELEQYLNRVIELKEERQTRQYQIMAERRNMTASLRYKILERDKFMCQICGSTANDGVKLHVDHIIPVSKGGKTIESNLRTLCDRCNIGKSDKI